MAKKNKTIPLPTFLEIFQSQRVQVVTPKGGAHRDKTKYNRDQAKRDFRKEVF